MGYICWVGPRTTLVWMRPATASCGDVFTPLNTSWFSNIISWRRVSSKARCYTYYILFHDCHRMWWFFSSQRTRCACFQRNTLPQQVHKTCKKVWTYAHRPTYCIGAGAHVIRLGVRSGLKGGWGGVGETGNERHADEVMTCLALH